MDVRTRRAEKGEGDKDEISLGVHMKESAPLKWPHILHECAHRQTQTQTHRQTIHRHSHTNRV